MSAIDELWKEAKKDAVEADMARALASYQLRSLARLREALELGHAQGRLDMRSAAEAALMEACVSLGVPARTTDALLKAVRDARAPELQEPKP